MVAAVSNRSRGLAFTVLVALAASALPELRAQPMPVLGYVANENADPARLDAFRKGLASVGYAEGKNLKIEYRYAKLDRDYDAAVLDLISKRVDVIVAGNAAAAPAAAKATHTIPIVLAAVNDPVGLGIVESLEHPGGNVTGTTGYAPHLVRERVRLLKSLVPSLKRVGVFVNGSNKNNAAQVVSLNTAAQEFGLEVESFDVRSAGDVVPAMNQAIESGVDGFFNCVDTFINSQRFAIAKLAAQNRRPVIYTDREYVLAGGLMALGVGHLEGYFRAAEYVDKVLRGANPGDLPIAKPTEVTFSVSRSALRNLGLTLPETTRAQV